MSATFSPRAGRVRSGLTTLVLAGAAALLCVALGWLLVQRGPAVAIAPLVLVGLGAGLALGLSRPTMMLVALVGLIAAFPIARSGLGGAPLYFTDLLAAVVIFATLRTGLTGKRFHLLVLLYLATWVPAWLYQITRIDLLLEPTYGLLRNVAAVAVAVGAYEIARRRGQDAVKLLVLALAAGTILTSFITLGQAFGPTSDATRELLTTIAPTFTEGAYRVYPERAFALFAAPTALAGFLAMMLPLFFVFAGLADRRERLLLNAATVLAGVALIATYSRQWLPALVIGLVALLLIRPRAFGRAAALGGVAAVAGFFMLSSGGLDSAYLSERFSSLGVEDRNVQLRLDRQKEFFAVTQSDPADMLLGRGFAGQDIAARDLADANTTDELRAGVNDNSFLLEWFNHGIVAALLYLGIVLGVTAAALRGARRRAVESPALAALAAALVTAVALHFFDNYFSEAIFMKTLLWVLLGLTAGLLARRPAADGEEAT